MSQPELKPGDLTATLITRHFNPAWYAAVMGTAVVPLALTFTGADWIDWAARIMIPLASLMFLAALAPWLIKIAVHRDDSNKDFNHPVASSFLPTMPIALLIICLDLLKFGHLFFSDKMSHNLAFWLWVAGSIGIYWLGFVVIMHVFRNDCIKVGHANFGWLIPPVSKLLIPVAGFELAAIFPEHHDVLVGVSVASLGVGFFLFVFVGSAVYHRYLFEDLPMEKFAATFFIGIAPPAIISVALFKLIHLLGHHDVLGLTTANFVPLAKFLIVMHWGLAAWWFVMALIMITYYRFKRSLPFALSWWAFTFPSGAMAISSGVAWQVSHFSFIRIFYNGVTIYLLAVWLLVFAFTLRGVISRKLFMPAH
ncbi:MAG: hypothetical protein QNL91_16555 [Candidatus Krumholzibacteria bacterium]|nr:hypothetical protein [Candidatus Krumholzibacteria bacterium]